MDFIKSCVSDWPITNFERHSFYFVETFFKYIHPRGCFQKKKLGPVNTHTVGIAKKHLLENFSIAREGFKLTHSVHLCFKM